MMQQTLATANDELAALVAGIQNDVAVPRDGKTCKPNEWAFPTSDTTTDRHLVTASPGTGTGPRPV